MSRIRAKMRIFTTSSWLLVALILSAACLVGHAHADGPGSSSEGQEEDFMKAVHMSDFMSDAQLAKRANDFSQLDGRQTDNLMWGRETNNGSLFTLANMTLFANDGERILSVERFRPMLKSIQCGENMTLAFNTRQNFEYAIREWNWVNDNETHSFTLVADDPGCGLDDDRAAFHIYDVDYDEKNFIAYLFGVEKEWKEIAHDFDLEYSSASLSDSKSGNAKRGFGDWDWGYDWDLDIYNEFNFNIIDQQYPEFGLKLDCADCKTSGVFKSDFRFEVRNFVPKDIHWGAAAKGVRADLGFELALRHTHPTLRVSFSYSAEVFSIPIGPALPPIRNLAKLGFYFTAKIGVSTNVPKQDSVIKFGAYAKLSEDSVVQLSLAGEKENKFHGWRDTVGAKPFDIEGDYDGSVDVYAQYTVGPKAEFLGKGIEAVIVGRLPQFQNRINTFNEKGSGTACEKKGINGVSLDTYAGASLGVRAGKSGDFAIQADFAPVVFGPQQQRSVDPMIDEEDSVQMSKIPNDKVKRRALRPDVETESGTGRTTDIAERGPEKRWLGIRIAFIFLQVLPQEANVVSGAYSVIIQANAIIQAHAIVEVNNESNATAVPKANTIIEINAVSNATTATKTNAVFKATAIIEANTIVDVNVDIVEINVKTDQDTVAVHARNSYNVDVRIDQDTIAVNSRNSYDIDVRTDRDTITHTPA